MTFLNIGNLLEQFYQDKDGIVEYLDSIEEDEMNRMMNDLQYPNTSSISTGEIIHLLMCSSRTRFRIAKQTLQLVQANTFTGNDAIFCLSELRIGYLSLLQQQCNIQEIGREIEQLIHVIMEYITEYIISKRMLHFGWKLIIEILPIFIEVKAELYHRSTIQSTVNEIDLEPPQQTIQQLVQISNSYGITLPILHVFIDCSIFITQEQWNQLITSVEQKDQFGREDAQGLFRAFFDLIEKLPGIEWFNVLRIIIKRNTCLIHQLIAFDTLLHRSTEKVHAFLKHIHHTSMEIMNNTTTEKVVWTDVILLIDMLISISSSKLRNVQLNSYTINSKLVNRLLVTLFHLFEALNHGWSFAGSTSQCNQSAVFQIIQRILHMNKNATFASSKRSSALIDAANEWLRNNRKFNSSSTCSIAIETMISIFAMMPSSRSIVLGGAIHGVTHYSSTLYGELLSALVRSHGTEVAELMDHLQSWISPCYYYPTHLRAIFIIFLPLIQVSSAFYNYMMISLRKILGAGQMKLIAAEMLCRALGQQCIESSHQEEIVSCLGDAVRTIPNYKERTQLFTWLENALSEMIAREVPLEEAAFTELYRILVSLFHNYFREEQASTTTTPHHKGRQKNRTTFAIKDSLNLEFDDPVHRIMKCIWLLENKLSRNNVIAEHKSTDFAQSIKRWLENPSVIASQVNQGLSMENPKHNLLDSLTMALGYYISLTFGNSQPTDAEKCSDIWIVWEILLLTLQVRGSNSTMEKSKFVCLVSASAILSAAEQILVSAECKKCGEKCIPSLAVILFVLEESNEYLRNFDRQSCSKEDISRFLRASVRLYSTIVINNHCARFKETAKPSSGLWEFYRYLTPALQEYVDSKKLLPCIEQFDDLLEQIYIQMVQLIGLVVHTTWSLKGDEATIEMMSEHSPFVASLQSSWISHDNYEPIYTLSALTLHLLLMGQAQIAKGAPAKVAIAFLQVSTKLDGLTVRNCTNSSLLRQKMHQICFNIMCEQNVSNCHLLRQLLRIMFEPISTMFDTEEYYKSLIAIVTSSLPVSTNKVQPPRKRLKQKVISNRCVDDDDMGSNSSREPANFQYPLFETKVVQIFVLAFMLGCINECIESASPSSLPWERIHRLIQLLCDTSKHREILNSSVVTKLTKMFVKCIKKSLEELKLVLRRTLTSNCVNIVKQHCTIASSIQQWGTAIQAIPVPLTVTHKRDLAFLLCRIEMYQMTIFRQLNTIGSNNELDKTVNEQLTKLKQSVFPALCRTEKPPRIDLVQLRKAASNVNDKRKRSKNRVRSRHPYIDNCLLEESGDDTYADLEDFIEA